MLVTLLAWALYAAVFQALYPSAGVGVGALTLVWVAALAWYWGLLGGLSAGFASFFVNGYLYAEVGIEAESWAEVIVPSLPGFLIGGFVGYFRQLQNKLREQQALIISKSERDDLTGVYNRSTFVSRLESIIAPSDETVAVMFVDLDDFKAVNDTYGHSAGDAILREVAQRLLVTARKGDPVARIGGDEFALVASGLSRRGDAEVIARRLLNELCRPYHVEGLTLAMAASVGIALHPSDGDTGQLLLRHADTALYRVKRQGKNGFGLYMRELDRHTTESHQLQFDLHGALWRGEFELVYQPQFTLPDGRLVGFESLLRWNHPLLGQLPPAGFVSILESNGMIVPVGEWVLKEACRQLGEWRRLGFEELTVAVNLSPAQLTNPGLLSAVANALESADLPASSLEVEITETVFAQDLLEASRTLRKLGEMGVHVTLDDFGTGYSSFDFLRRHPFRTLKADRSLVKDIVVSREATSILRAVVSLAHELKLSVVAEGVESEEQRSLVERFGCDYVQGHLFGKALSSEEARDKLIGVSGGHGTAERVLG